MKINSRPFIILSIIALGLLILFTNLIRIQYNCYHATDFSIYQQAIYELASFESLNPYLTIRDIKIFNDHFDPIIFIAIPFVKIFNYSPHSLIIFEFLIFLFFCLIGKKTLPSHKNSVYLLLMFFLTKAFLSGLFYPIHPSTWSLVPILLLANFSQTNQHYKVILTAFCLCLFREVFPIALVFFSMGYFLLKSKKHSLIMALISLSFIYWTYFLREDFLGPTVSYGSEVLKNLLFSPLEQIKQIQLLPFVKIIFPFLLPLYILCKPNWKTLNTPIIYFLIPLLGLHLLLNKTHSQYGPFLIAPLWGFILYHPNIKELLNNSKILKITLIFFILSSMGTYTKAFKTVFFKKDSKCLIERDKNSKTNEIKKIIALQSEDKTILSTGGLVPNILLPGKKIYQAGLFSQQLDFYDLLILEKNNSGDIFPFKNENIMATINNCTYNVLMNNQYYFVATGPIPHHCLTPLWERHL